MSVCHFKFQITRATLLQRQKNVKLAEVADIQTYTKRENRSSVDPCLLTCAVSIFA